MSQPGLGVEPTPGGSERSALASRARSMAFVIGDCVFLVIVGVLAVIAAQLARGLEWSPLVSWIPGMALAMAAQTALAFVVSPILGSIESMAPSMIVAMVLPMVLEGIDMVGFKLAPWTQCYVGGLCGLLAFVLLRWYGVSCRRYFGRTCGGS